MSYFDNSTVCYAQDASPATYHSYMCRSKSEYGSPDTEKLLQTVNYDQLWGESQEKLTLHREKHHISKLRNILSETISNVTKDSKLQQGESVELTLEIELMKTESHTPSNSLVEVTIVQHNKKEANLKNKSFTGKKNNHQTESKSLASEQPSQKRRNWFQRVINMRNDLDPIDQSTTTKQQTDRSRTLGKSGFYLDQNLISNNSKNTNHKRSRSNFIKVLPEKIPIGCDFAKGYRRVSPEKKSPKAEIKTKNAGSSKPVLPRKKSLVKKISDLFLPKKKSGKNKAVKTALTALKNEVDNIKLQSGKVREGKENTKRAPVHNLGKLVGNILDDMVETSNTVSTNEIKGDSVALKYQSFFEPVTKLKTKRKEINSHKKRTNLTKRKISQSHSDTCCLHFKYNSSELKIKTSNSVSSFKAYSNSNNQIHSLENGDSTKLNSTKKYQSEDKKNKNKQKSDAKGDAVTQIDHKDSKKIPQKNYKALNTKKSTIEWNGQTVEVNKAIKTKIEMLIVNELQNLALKEGMECDVIPLHSSEYDNNYPVEKVSSFFCELDISDKKLKKLMRNKKNTDTNTSSSKTKAKKLKNEQSSSKSKLKRKMDINEELSTTNQNPVKTGTQITSLVGDSEKSGNERSDITCSKDTINSRFSPGENCDMNGVKVTYVNMNVKNWSTESTIMKFGSSYTTDFCQQDSKMDNANLQVFRFGEDNNIYQKAISSGFIKRIDSNDSTWKNCWLGANEKVILEENCSKQLVSVTNTKSTVRFSSATSNEYQSSIEIELDIKDLELILKEAKQKQKSDKVLVSAKCKRENKQQKEIKFTGRNSPTYTNQVLTSAAEKLDKYVKRKKKQHLN